MKKVIIIILSLVFSNIVLGQTKGSGKIVHKSFDFKDFDKVDFKDFDGEIYVNTGKPWSIDVEIDDNLANLLEVKITSEKEHQLSVRLLKNENGKKYLENTSIKIKINMPSASVITHRGNSNVHIDLGQYGRYFRYETKGNGNTKLAGGSDKLDIEKFGNGDLVFTKITAKSVNLESKGNGNNELSGSTDDLYINNAGNGDTNAHKLTAKTVKVKNLGNGDVHVNTQISLDANGTGNGDIIYSGPGKIGALSGVIGNGELKHHK